MADFVRQSVYRNQEAGRQPAHSVPLADGQYGEKKDSLKSIEELQDGVEKAVTWK